MPATHARRRTPRGIAPERGFERSLGLPVPLQDWTASATIGTRAIGGGVKALASVAALLMVAGCAATGKAKVAGAPSVSISIRPVAGIPSSSVASDPASTPRVAVKPVSPPAVTTPVLGASGLVESYVSSTLVQAQPWAGACHASSTGLLALPDPHCTPGALNPAVDQADIHSTICVTGYSESIRPSEGITEPEKIASLATYGDPDSPGSYEYDHLVPLELGGAANDPRNLWPEPGATPNPKDSLENRLHDLVCAGELSLASAQRSIAANWISAYRAYIGVPGGQSTVQATAPPPPPPPPPSSNKPVLSCTATMSNSSPRQYSTTDVIVHTAPGAGVDTVAHYKTKDTQHSSSADSSGVAEIPYYISGATVGYTVEVDVTVTAAGATTNCSTSFTPQ